MASDRLCYTQRSLSLREQLEAAKQLASPPKKSRLVCGLHWHINKVFWGRQNNPGSLRGAASHSQNPVEFREQRGIYFFYADYDLVYVGQTGAGDDRLFKRLRTHRSDHLAERWNRFSWFGTQWMTLQHHLSTDTAAVHESITVVLNILEAVVIAVSEPRLRREVMDDGRSLAAALWLVGWVTVPPDPGGNPPC